MHIEPFYYFNRDLEPVVSAAESNNWLEIVLMTVDNERSECFAEIRTRFLLATTGRHRQLSLVVARKIAEVQKRWAVRGVSFVPFGNLTQPQRFLPQDRAQAPFTAVLEEAAFTDNLERCATSDVATALSVHLEHQQDRPADHWCTIRTRFLLLGDGRGVRASLRVADTIASLQQEWMRRYGAQFYIHGRVHDYLYRLHRASSKLKPIRAYGEASQAARFNEVLILHRLYSTIAACWTRYQGDPIAVTLRTFGYNALTSTLYRIGSARNAVVAELRGFESEIQQLDKAIELGRTRALPPHISRLVEGYLTTHASPTEARPRTGSDVVLEMVRLAVASDVPPEFAADARTGVWPPVDRNLVEQAGRTLGYIGRRLVPDVDAVAQAIGKLIARELAQRYEIAQATVLKTIVRPALGGFLGYLAPGSEDLVRP